jgi:serine/threonine protein kinase
LSDPFAVTGPNESGVRAALEEYLERLDRGEVIDREQFLAQRSEIAEELRSFIAAEEQVRMLVKAERTDEQVDKSTHSLTRDGQQTVVTPAEARRSADTDNSGLKQEFGRYRILKALGQGAMGTVYLAEDRQLQRQVALKTPHFQDEPTAEQIERFYREARAAATLRHANICTVHDVGEIDGTHFISMAYIEGRPLADYVNPPQSEVWILTLVRKLALALQVAHDHGVIHRDLKPSNVMVDQQNEPIITDFGLARLIHQVEDVRLTKDGALVGSPAYMAPEQFERNCKRVESRTDLYSLGVILYELLTGTVPFPGTLTAVIGQILGKQPEPPSRLRPNLDPRIETVCLRMISKQPQDRFPSLKAVADELSTIMETSAPPKHKDLTTTQTWISELNSGKRSRSVLAVGLLIAAIAIAALGTSAWLDLWPRVKNTANEGGAAQEPAAAFTSQPLSSRTLPLGGTVNVRIWDPKNASRRGLDMTDPTALPLQSGDQIRVDARLNRPAYLYLIWIGPDGVAQPIYPWKQGDWTLKPAKEQPVAELSLPEAIDEAWPIGGGPGMETLILLARDQPLDAEIALKDVFASLPPQRIQDARSLVWLDQGEIPHDKTRSPKFFEPQKLDDPLLRTQGILTQKLKVQFPLIRAVSFANRGK